MATDPLFDTSRPKEVKEYIVASKLDQHPTLATQKKQFITLQMPEDPPRQWRIKGFTHIYFDVVRVAVMYHRRKGHPVVAPLSLHDTDITNANMTTWGLLKSR